jgi:hypothetical protein
MHSRQPETAHGGDAAHCPTRDLEGAAQAFQGEAKAPPLLSLLGCGRLGHASLLRLTLSQDLPRQFGSTSKFSEQLMLLLDGGGLAAHVFTQFGLQLAAQNPGLPYQASDGCQHRSQP